LRPFYVRTLRRGHKEQVPFRQCCPAAFRFVNCRSYSAA